MPSNGKDRLFLEAVSAAGSPWRDLQWPNSQNVPSRAYELSGRTASPTRCPAQRGATTRKRGEFATTLVMQGDLMRHPHQDKRMT